MTENTARRWTLRTLAAQALGHIDEPSRAVVPPIHVATTYMRDPDNQYRSGNIYGRPDNATIREAEAIIAALEGAAAALVLGSGMSAATAVFLALSPGDHVVAPKVRGGRYYDPLAVFGALGMVTSSIRFAAHVLVLQSENVPELMHDIPRRAFVAQHDVVGIPLRRCATAVVADVRHAEMLVRVEPNLRW